MLAITSNVITRKLNPLVTLKRISYLLAILLIVGCAQAPKTVQGIAFYPEPPQIPRIQFLTSISSEEDIGVERDQLMEFVTGKKKVISGIGRPWDIEHEKGKIHVVDKMINKVVTVDLDQRKFHYMSDLDGGSLVNPGGLFITRGGSKYIADQGRNQVLVYDRTDQLVQTYEAGPESRPTDVVVDGDMVYVTDLNDNDVKIFDRASGELTGSIDGSGNAEGELHAPTHLTIGADGALYITDFLNFRVQKFDSDNEFVRTMGEAGDFPGAMPRPKGIAIDRENHLYVVDSAFEMVQIFDALEGNLLLTFGKYGSLNGGTWLPSGIDIDYDNIAYFSSYIDSRFKAKYLIYVANQSGPFKINVYAYGDWKGEQQLPGVRKTPVTE